MSGNRKRLFYVNKYQVRILVAVLALPLAIILALLLFTNAFFEQLFVAVGSGSASVLTDFAAQWKFTAYALLWGLFTAVVLIGYLVSKNLLGAFTRIFRELDEVLAGERDAPITARKRDDLANELLDRVNALVDRRPGSGA